MDLLRRAFRDITAGHTRATVRGRTAFIRHLSHSDHIDLDQRREDLINDARDMGVPTEADKLVELRKAGQWTDDQDRGLAAAKRYIGELEEGKRNPKIHPSMVAGYVTKIADATKDYEAKALARRRALALTCEAHADRELNDYYIVSNLFDDAAMRTPFMSEWAFDYLPEGEVSEIVNTYNGAMEACSDRNLKRLAMAPFFQRYFGLVGDDLMAFFGKPVATLTLYQVELLRYAGHFRHIYQQHDVSSWRKEVLDDPDLLTDYANAVTKGKADLAQQGANEEGAMVIGLKKEDAKAMGVRQGANPMSQIAGQFGGNMLEWAAKVGGS